MCHHMLRLRGVFMVYGFGEKKIMVYGFRGNFLWFMVSHTPPQNPPPNRFGIFHLTGKT